ncbi:MAG TPA: SUMF1/EgtB/PvdO family nonheme iron enzyme [bacterium]|nr:SUMF1/EgtB/PvdO family nonheme iron enzyme [bacterium]
MTRETVRRRRKTKMFRTWIAVVLGSALGGTPVAPAVAAPAAVTIETVTVGNPGNPGEQSISGDPTFYGGVAYTYAIGKYEVTAGQYTAFLNAVASTDTYGLYHTRMDFDADSTRHGCNIKRQGSPGSYTYSVAPDWTDRPVNYVSWADAARFANWLHNGQPAGAQDSTTTERGTYLLDGVSQGNDTALEDILREPDATWAIPSEDEWYKAAYHKNDGVSGNYWNYPTSTDAGVDWHLIDPDPGNNATKSGGAIGLWTIDAPYYRTSVGAHENSESPYGTFDQGGNVMEFTEAVPESDIRRIRGGSWYWAGLLGAWDVDDVMHSSDQLHDLGFRVVSLQVGPVSAPLPRAASGLRFAIVGSHPVREQVHFQAELPEAAHVRIDFFDVAGRRVGGAVDEAMPAGTNEVRWRTRDLAPGVYLARLSALGRSEVVRFVRLR